MKKSVIFVVILLLLIPIVYSAVIHPISGQKTEEINLTETQVKERLAGDVEHYVYGMNGLVAIDNGTVRYVHSDHLGSNRIVTDENGEVLEESKYFPFGEPLQDRGSRFTYTGKELDGKSKLQYSGARYYDQDVGRFTQVDPVKDGLNWYVYTANNPMKYVDPTGTRITGGNLVGIPYDRGEGATPQFSWASSDQSNSFHPEHFFASGINIVGSVLNGGLAALSSPDHVFAFFTSFLPENHVPSPEDRADILNSVGATAAQFYVLKTQAAVYGPSAAAGESTSVGDGSTVATEAQQPKAKILSSRPARKIRSATAFRDEPSLQNAAAPDRTYDYGVTHGQKGGGGLKFMYDYDSRTGLPPVEADISFDTVMGFYKSRFPDASRPFFHTSCRATSQSLRATANALGRPVTGSPLGQTVPSTLPYGSNMLEYRVTTFLPDNYFTQ
ncbi:MAG: RHS repeat-associated core domain-containing protein [Nanoarchaeota archaeon]|nr:hypothetical protein [Nanoarchaeota archaeon]MBU1444707.1 hypothetical protein [Nanoarchaeota archaeon]MBU2406969.1 hypothetical protein [Nanoarchaeota archaeon]MBU2420559.1 hypothetical protein [Nanoarchaeota archaeon]MBU2475782.1 hypothetical protein [Nanoarchaeota archaeon]